jgi:hypothetical protein
MGDHTTTHTRLTRLTLRGSVSSVARLLGANFAPCVLDPLGHARPRAHVAMESTI